MNLMENEVIIRDIELSLKENTKKAVKDFVQNHIDIEVDERHIFTAYRKGAIKTRPINGHQVKIPRIMLVKCSNQFKEILSRNMNRLKGKRHPIEGYGYYIDKNVSEAHQEARE